MTYHEEYLVGVAPPLLGDEGEAALLLDEDAQHIPGLDHVTFVLLVTSPVKGETATAGVAFRHLKTQPPKVLE